jgi:hypothetical protein
MDQPPESKFQLVLELYFHIISDEWTQFQTRAHQLGQVVVFLTSGIRSADSRVFPVFLDLWKTLYSSVEPSSCPKEVMAAIASRNAASIQISPNRPLVAHQPRTNRLQSLFRPQIRPPFLGASSLATSGRSPVPRVRSPLEEAMSRRGRETTDVADLKLHQMNASRIPPGNVMDQNIDTGELKQASVPGDDENEAVNEIPEIIEERADAVLDEIPETVEEPVLDDIPEIVEEPAGKVLDEIPETLKDPVQEEIPETVVEDKEVHEVDEEIPETIQADCVSVDLGCDSEEKQGHVEETVDDTIRDEVVGELETRSPVMSDDTPMGSDDEVEVIDQKAAMIVSPIPKKKRKRSKEHKKSSRSKRQKSSEESGTPSLCTIPMKNGPLVGELAEGQMPKLTPRMLFDFILRTDWGDEALFRGMSKQECFDLETSLMVALTKTRHASMSGK